MTSRDSLLAGLAAILLVAGVTLVEGRWTERWAEQHDEALANAARRLERSFPVTFGEWQQDRQLETSKAELERAGAVGSVSRVYRNQKTKTPVSAFVVCASPHDASGHTPDRCYPGAGFEIAEQEHREKIQLRDGRTAEAYTGTFAREGTVLRVFWTYGVPKKAEDSTAAATPAPTAEESGRDPDAPRPLAWVAPQIARITLNEFPAVYKLYAIIDQSKMPSSRAMAECSDFIAEALPAFEEAIASGDSPASVPSEPTPADEPAAG